MGCTNKRRSTSLLLIRTLTSIGMILFSTQNVQSWAPEKSLIRRPHRDRFRVVLESYKNSWIEKQLSSPMRTKRKSVTRTTMLIDDLQSILQLLFACMGMSIILISWEDISMPHPMRIERVEPLTRLSTTSSSQSLIFSPEFPLRWGRSTIRGLASGGTERQAISIAGDLESSTYKNLPSYNEIMLTHRAERVPLWNAKDKISITSRKDVVDSVRTIQLALLHVRECVELAQDYEWDQLTESLNEKIFRTDLQKACYILKSAEEFLPREARDEIGFDWGSCAWRHCGALSDAQEAIDALEHQVGMLEPFECIYCLDVIERSLRDILAVSKNYSDDSLKVPEYIPIQRMSDLSSGEDDILDRQDADYMNTLSILRNSEFD